MTKATPGHIWHRAGPLTIGAALAVAAGAQMAACGGDSGNPGTGGSSSTSMHSSSHATGTGGGGGSGGSGVSSLKPGADANSAFDATPSPDGKDIYYTAVDAKTRLPGVYTAPADGSHLAGSPVHEGDPFVAPFGIAISTDGSTLYVADSGATASKKDRGVIFSLSAGGGNPSEVSGTELYRPRSLDVVNESGKDEIYFTGHDKTDGQPGVFKVPASGGAVTAVVKGHGLVDPSGIAVAPDGKIYVADAVGASTHDATILEFTGSTPSTFAPDIRVGYPCGVALSKNGETLLVSALDPQTMTDLLLLIDVATKTQTKFSKGIDTFTESAGLHRAHDAELFAWADSKAGPAGGRVFVVQ
jgi:DNA-binding beta-propeller fold protein YncE